MLRRLFLLLLLAWASDPLQPTSLWACPNCADAVPLSSGAEGEEGQQLALGYNRSIYLLLAVPYLAVGLLGYVVVRRLSASAGQGSGTFVKVKENERSTTPEGAR